MAYSDQLKIKQRQYMAAYSNAQATASNIKNALNALSTVSNLSKSCYQVNDVAAGGNYLKNTYDNLNNVYNYIINTVLPRTSSIINEYNDLIRYHLDMEAQQKVNGGLL